MNCIMCNIEQDLYDKKMDIPSVQSYLAKELPLHRLFKYYHQEEPCHKYRETEKIKGLREDAMNKLIAISDLNFLHNT